MKKQILITILLVLWLAFTVWAADMTITIPTNDVPRVQEAFGSILGLGRPANLSEVQRATTNWIHGSTTDYERRKNMATYSPPPMEMQPTPTPTPGGLRAAETPTTKASSPTPTPKKKK